MIKKLYQLFLYLTILPIFCFGQNKADRFSADFDNTPFPQVIESLQQNFDVSFSYAGQALDSLTVSAKIEKEDLYNSLDIVLDQLPVTFQIKDGMVFLYLEPDKQYVQYRYKLSISLTDNYGNSVNQPLMVELFMYENDKSPGRENARSLVLRETLENNENGSLDFHNLKPAEYRIRISGNDFYRKTENTVVKENDLHHELMLIRKSPPQEDDYNPKNPKTESIGNVKVTFESRSLTVNTLISSIQKSGVNIQVDDEILESDRMVELSDFEMKVLLALEQAFEDREITITEFSDKIILRKKKLDADKYTISGTITDRRSGESLIGVSVRVKGTELGNTTNQYGFYSVTIPEGDYVLLYSYLGYAIELKEVNLFENQRLDVFLEENVETLNEVVINSESVMREVSEIDMGVKSLKIKTLKSMPAFMGEVDVIKSITLIPGVSTVGEGTTGFNVRGGAIDQNLVILDEAPIYNTSHLFGFFSVFNSDIIKDVNLYKSGIPARYGGRLSSVLDITQKEGNNQKFTMAGGIGIVGARLSVEGPLKKGKSSFLIGGRKSFIGDILTGIEDFEEDYVGFHDLNSKINFQLNDKNRVYLSGYLGEDDFELGSEDIVVGYRNLTTTLRWNHLFNSKLFSNFSAVYSNYKYTQGSTEEDFEFAGETGIITSNLKSDFTYFVNSNHTLDFGLNVLHYHFKGLTVGPNSDSSPYVTIDVADDYAFEPALYIQDEFQVNEWLQLSLGLRYSAYLLVGPGSVYIYDENQSRDITTIVDTVSYQKGEIIARYSGLEPRISSKFKLSKNSILQISYDRSRQNIHLISNTTSATPLDIWKSTNTYLKPEIGDQYALGFFHNFDHNNIETSIQGYFKNFKNVVDYKDGTNLILNQALDADIISGVGRAYGVEFSLSKQAGRFKGWMSYTYSKTERKIKGRFLSETINNGNYYPANYDFPNRLTFAGSFQLSPRISVSANFTYNTGRPTTYPDGRYIYAGFVVPHYSTRNLDRLPDYHRLDLSITFDSKPEKKWTGQWVIGVFNLYGRKNAYSIYLRRIGFTQNTESIRLSILGSVIPSLTYNFKF